MTIALSTQIQAVDREIAKRKSVYPGLVARRKMRQGEADLQIKYMEAVLDTLLWLSQNEAAIKEALRPRARATDET